ncbi:MAG TPA: toxin-antitoxin system HicB family antitoxin [Anaerolineaceae bacterium]|mgnify:FL=1|nr:toxin-antitoxin system HicB family antitoxin [Anaerolineaceae bacterium]
MNEAEKLLEKLKNVPAEEPDEWEKQAIAEAKARAQSDREELVPFEHVKERALNANGRISLRVPRQLHIDLIEGAEEQGVSLNQFISYLLASSIER